MGLMIRGGYVFQFPSTDQAPKFSRERSSVLTLPVFVPTPVDSEEKGLTNSACAVGPWNT